MAGVCEMDQPVCCGGRQTLEVPSQAPCIHARVLWPCWAEGVAGQPKEDGEPLLAHQSEEYLSEQLRDREHLELFTVHISGLRINHLANKVKFHSLKSYKTDSGSDLPHCST